MHIYQARGGRGSEELYREYLGTMEKKMETTIMGFYRVWGLDFWVQGVEFDVWRSGCGN